MNYFQVKESLEAQYLSFILSEQMHCFYHPLRFLNILKACRGRFQCTKHLICCVRKKSICNDGDLNVCT